ncbi:MAG TPA: hypothetical protein VNW47_03110 [Terriglobales bacterium]|jgi:hypothetical protein|nr:hypothetical protein [Terriglobales bacterium]
MDRQIDVASNSNVAVKRPYNSGHLMCRATPWGIMGFLACGYFAWISFSLIMRGRYYWPHDGWTAATYVVWIVLLIGLMLDTRCLRERFFFGVLVLNFLIGFGLTLWRTLATHQVHTARIGTGVLWALAAVVSLTTMGRGSVVGREQGGK